VDTARDDGGSLLAGPPAAHRQEANDGKIVLLMERVLAHSYIDKSTGLTDDPRTVATEATETLFPFPEGEDT